MLLSDYILQVRQLVHDLQGNDFSNSDLIGYINTARQRVALDAHCVRSFYTGLNLIPLQERYPITGGVGGAQLTLAGSGYAPPPAAPPAVTIAAAPAGGVTATAVATVSAAGTVSLVTITNWGSGYVTTPSITIAPPGAGVTATAVAITLLNVLDILSISILWPGNTNRYTLGWLPFTPFQAFCRTLPTFSRNPSVWTNFDEINAFFLYPIPDQSYISEIDAIVLPNPLVGLSESDLQILQPNADAVQFYAAHLALIKLQNFEHADYLNKKYEARLQQIKLTRQDRRYQNVYRSWYRRLNRM